MEHTESNSYIKELTPEEYKKTYSSFDSTEVNAMKATQLRVFGKDEIDGNFFLNNPELYPNFNRIYPEELLKAEEYAKRNKWKPDSIKALKITAGSAVAAASLAGILSGSINPELPPHPTDDNSPEKQTILQLEESPSKAAEAEIERRLEKAAKAGGATAGVVGTIYAATVAGGHAARNRKENVRNPDGQTTTGRS